MLVEIGAASLCRSDLSVVTGARVWPLPTVKPSPGHRVLRPGQATSVHVRFANGKTRVSVPGPLAKRGDAAPRRRRGALMIRYSP